MSSVLDLYGPNFLDATGFAGLGLCVLNYTMLTFQRVKSESIIYFVINGSAACLVLIGLINAFSFSPAMIQIFFICISCVAIILRLRDQHRTQSQRRRSILS